MSSKTDPGGSVVLVPRPEQFDAEDSDDESTHGGHDFFGPVSIVVVNVEQNTHTNHHDNQSESDLNHSRGRVAFLHVVTP